MNSLSCWRKILPCSLALCLVWAGVVGLSPLLHQLVEHGGHGPAHSHLGQLTPTPRKIIHQHQRHSPQPAVAPKVALGQHERPFQLPFLSQLRESFSRWLSDQGPDADDDGPAPVDHEHHSLPQLMAGGFIDFQLDLPLLFQPHVLSTDAARPADELLRARDWDAQTASRAPPLVRS